ncbi:MAG: DUF262 domain-containing protein [Chthoniobacterales bacterium]
MKMTAQKRALDKIYKRRNRYEIPEWQRGEVWDRTKKQRLIDTILRGWKLPKFYLLKTTGSPDEFEVLDGQQRLTTIFEFFDNELSLSAQSAAQFGGEYYRDLPTDVSDEFDDFEIEYDEIEDAGEEEQREFFQRLQEGLPLTSSERLNSVYSKLRDYAVTLAKHEFFTKKVSASNKRYGHFDIASKVSAIAIEGIGVGLRFEDLKQTFEAQKNFSSRSAIAKRLKQAFDCAAKVFSDADPLLKNRTHVQSFVSLIYRLCDSENINKMESVLRAFFPTFMQELTKQVELGQHATDPDYIEFQKSVNANVRGAAKTRQDVLLRKLLSFDPKVADLLDPAAVSESGIAGNIRRLGTDIAEQVGRINSAYAAKHGSDLFKPTNRTTQALTNCGKPIGSIDDYKNLIDDLYFLFHEGPGQRLQQQKPQSFTDVNALRTDLQHDVDHGSSGPAKRKKFGATFQKFGGSASPETLAPERFPLVQSKLLTELLSDLRKLAAEADAGTL